MSAGGLGRHLAAAGEPFDATDAGVPFVQTSIDGATTPAEASLGDTGRAAAQGECDFGPEGVALVAGEGKDGRTQ